MPNTTTTSRSTSEQQISSSSKLRRSPSSRRLGRRLVNLADDDRWGAALSILLDRRRRLRLEPQQQEQRHTNESDAAGVIAWLGATTKPGGDGLVHLSSFAACDSDLSLRDRRRAARCLELILEDDPTAVTRIAGDGGTALHGAVAAAAGSAAAELMEMDGFAGGNDDDEEAGPVGGNGESGRDDDSSSAADYGSSSSSCDYDEEDHSDRDDYDDELLGGIDPDSGILPPTDPLHNYDGGDLVLRVVTLLLSAGADPNVPLGVQASMLMAGTNSCCNVNDGREEGEEDGMVELPYSREAVQQRWSSFAMTLNWLVLACSSSFPSSCSSTTGAQIIQSPVILPLAVLRRMLAASGGADPAYPLGGGPSSRNADADEGNNKEEWNAYHFVAGCSHLLSRRVVSGDEIMTVQKMLDEVATVDGDGEGRTIAAGEGEGESKGEGEGCEAEETIGDRAERTAAAADFPREGRSVHRYVCEMLLGKSRASDASSSATAAHRRTDKSPNRPPLLPKAPLPELPLEEPIQSFAAAILADDVPEASGIVLAVTAAADPSSSRSKEELIEEWRSKRLRDVLPTPAAAGWRGPIDGGTTAAATATGVSLLDAAAACLATRSVRFLLGLLDEEEVFVDNDGSGGGGRCSVAAPAVARQFGPSHQLSEEEATDALASVFEHRFFFSTWEEQEAEEEIGLVEEEEASSSVGGGHQSPCRCQDLPSQEENKMMGRIESTFGAIVVAYSTASSDETNAAAAAAAAAASAKEERSTGLSRRTMTVDADVAAARSRQRLLDKLLLRSCCEPGWWGLSSSSTAARGGNAPSVLLRLGADPNVRSVAGEVSGGYSPLHLVAANRRCSSRASSGGGGVAVVRRLLDGGADLYAEDDLADRPLDVALRSGNYRVVEFLWGEEQRRGCGATTPAVSKAKACMLGTAALECVSLPMIEEATRHIIMSIRSESNVDEGGDISPSAVVSEELGKLLLQAIDPRSRMSIACSRDSEVGVATLTKCVNVLTQDLDLLTDPKGNALPVIPAFTADGVSRQTCLHFLLRDDRGAELRNALVGRICEVAIAHETFDSSASSAGVYTSSSQCKSRLISLPCDDKFGRYSALHLACALGCEDSIVALVEHGADLDAVDCAGRSPKDLIREVLTLSESTRRMIGLE